MQLSMSNRNSASSLRYRQTSNSASGVTSNPGIDGLEVCYDDSVAARIFQSINKRLTAHEGIAL